MIYMGGPQFVQTLLIATRQDKYLSFGPGLQPAPGLIGDLHPRHRGIPLVIYAFTQQYNKRGAVRDVIVFISPHTPICYYSSTTTWYYRVRKLVMTFQPPQRELSGDSLTRPNNPIIKRGASFPQPIAWQKRRQFSQPSFCLRSLPQRGDPSRRRVWVSVETPAHAHRLGS